MSQRIIVDYPPIFDEIDAVFHIGTKPVIFSYGASIYNPQGVSIPPQLIAHEAVHGERQQWDVKGWWRRYIDSPQFRLEEEIPAHVAEYQWLVRDGRSRNERRMALKRTAKRMASPLYGRLVSPSQARRIISAADRA